MYEIRRGIDLLHDQWTTRDEYEFWHCVEQTLVKVFNQDTKKANDLLFGLWDKLSENPFWCGGVDVFYRNDPIDICLDLIVKETQIDDRELDETQWNCYLDILTQQATKQEKKIVRPVFGKRNFG